MWNPFKKKNNNTQNNAANSTAGGMQNVGFMQRLAMKKIMSMSEEERMKLMQKVMTPENIAKNKDQILAAMEQMKTAGTISDSQIEEAKKRFGI